MSKALVVNVIWDIYPVKLSFVSFVPLANIGILLLAFVLLVLKILLLTYLDPDVNAQQDM